MKGCSGGNVDGVDCGGYYGGTEYEGCGDARSKCRIRLWWLCMVFVVVVVAVSVWVVVAAVFVRVVGSVIITVMG